MILQGINIHLNYYITKIVFLHHENWIRNSCISLEDNCRDSVLHHSGSFLSVFSLHCEQTQVAPFGIQRFCLLELDFSNFTFLSCHSRSKSSSPEICAYFCSKPCFLSRYLFVAFVVSEAPLFVYGKGGNFELSHH